MPDITDYLNGIRNAVLGKEVREDIAAGIEQCYEDGRSGATDLTARRNISALNARVATAESEVETLEDDVAALEAGLAAAVGSPLAAATAAGMTDTTKVYVYTGSETGYTAGNWYYYDGSAWTSGGVYNAAAVQTDDSLSVSGMAADGKAAGAAIRVAKGMASSAGSFCDDRFGGDPVQEITGYNSANTQALLHTACPIMPMPLISGQSVSWIRMNVATAGTLSIGCYKQSDLVEGDAYDADSHIILREVTVESTGDQTISFTPAVYIPEGYVLAVSATTDSCQFYYGNTGETLGYYYFASATRLVTLHATKSLGINVGVLKYPKSVYAGKKLSIFGDSISTFAGYVPSGNAVYYTGSNAGVQSVDDLWWKEVVDALGLDLLVNNSWSGRAVSSVRDSSSGHTTDAGYKEANVLQLKDGTTLPDVIIVKLGINDFNYECPLGSYAGQTDLPTDPSTFTGAYAMMLDLIMTNFPLAQVYCCTLMPCEKNGTIGFPEINGNGNTILEFNEAIRKLAHAFGAKLLDHDVCGITYYNLSTYMGDYSASAQTGLHPNAAGHSLIANQTIAQMDAAVRVRY